MSVPPPGGEVALARVSELVGLGRWEDAAHAARMLLVSEPASWQAQCLLAQALCGLGDFQGALSAAQSAIALNPASDWPQRLASIAARSLSRPTPALTHALEAVRLAPYLADSHRVLAQALVVGGDLDGAAAEALRGLELSPSEAVSHRLIGAIAVRRGEIDAAEAAFRHALALDPDDAVSHNELARIALRRSQLSSGGLASSARGFASALVADPRQTGSRRNLEVVLRLFLARGAYFLFLAAVVSTLALAHDRSISRVLGALVLVVPVGFTVRFLAALTPSLRATLLSTVRGDGVLLGAVGAELVAVGGVAVGSLAELPGVCIGGVLAALVARMLVSSRRQR